MASDFGKPRPGSGSQSSRDWLKQSPDPIGKNRWGGFKVQKKGMVAESFVVVFLQCQKTLRQY